MLGGTYCLHLQSLRAANKRQVISVLFNPDGGDSMFQQNCSKLLPDLMTSQYRKLHS
jgi:hypothetical protein